MYHSDSLLLSKVRPQTVVFRALYLFGFFRCVRTRRITFPIASRAVGSGFLQGVYSSMSFTPDNLQTARNSER